jgi:hypothetical protein
LSNVKTEVVQCPYSEEMLEIRTTVESSQPGFIKIDKGSVRIPKKKIGTLIKQLKAWK